MSAKALDRSSSTLSFLLIGDSGLMMNSFALLLPFLIVFLPNVDVDFHLISSFVLILFDTYLLLVGIVQD